MKKLFCSIILVCSGLLTGCVQFVDMTDKQSNILTEYMASAVLNHSGYETSLIFSKAENTEQVKETQGNETQGDEIPGKETQGKETQGTETQGKETQNKENQKVGTDINEVFGLKDFSIEYSNYEELDIYPSKMGDTYFNLEAGNGNKLVVLNFKIKNQSDKTKSFNLINENLKYKVKIKTGSIYYPILTLLTEDLQFMNADIPSKDTLNAVVVFEVSNNIDISNAIVSITKEDKTTIIELN